MIGLTRREKFKADVGKLLNSYGLYKLHDARLEETLVNAMTAQVETYCPMLIGEGEEPSYD